jgi:hypothetical protein
VNRKLLFFVLLLTLCCAPALFACESCVAKGQKDPNGGGPYGSALCWTGGGGVWSWCIGGNLLCDGGDPEGTCAGGGNCGNSCVENPVLRSSPTAEKKCNVVDVSGRCGGGRKNQFSFLL